MSVYHKMLCGHRVLQSVTFSTSIFFFFCKLHTACVCKLAYSFFLSSFPHFCVPSKLVPPLPLLQHATCFLFTLDTTAREEENNI